nr:cupredoxin domain-containing protein [Paenibacillus alkalitolerans]
MTVLWERSQAVPADAMPVSERVIHMVTGEFKTITKDGEELEAYRWDPGTVFVNKGENVKLVLLGVNGENHPFVIEGLNIQGSVTKGKETIVNFHASKEGIFRIICLAHPDASNNGPMIGYIVVD